MKLIAVLVMVVTAGCGGTESFETLSKGAKGEDVIIVVEESLVGDILEALQGLATKGLEVERVVAILKALYLIDEESNSATINVQRTCMGKTAGEVKNQQVAVNQWGQAVEVTLGSKTIRYSRDAYGGWTSMASPDSRPINVCSSGVNDESSLTFSEASEDNGAELMTENISRDECAVEVCTRWKTARLGEDLAKSLCKDLKYSKWLSVFKNHKSSASPSSTMFYGIALSPDVDVDLDCMLEFTK